MKAAAFNKPGEPDVLELMEIPTPQPDQGQVRVRVRAAGVQPYDLAIREGWTPPGIPENLPRVPGNEFAGVVDQLGDGVTGIEVGAEVIGYTLLTAYAEYATTGFTGMFPGHRFRIDDVLAHHDRSLARWTQISADGEPVRKSSSCPGCGARRRSGPQDGPAPSRCR